MKIFWTTDASKSLKDCFLYFKKTASLKIAKKLRKEIQARPRILIDHPNAGQEEENLKSISGGYRYLLVLHFKIIYKIEQNKILITDLFDTRQDPQKLKTRNRK